MGWSIKRKDGQGILDNLASINENTGLATFKKHTAQTTVYIISYTGDTECGSEAITKEFTVYGCTEECNCDNANLSVTGKTLSSDGGNSIAVANFNTDCTNATFSVVKKQGDDFITDFTFDFTAKAIKANVSKLTDTSSGRECKFNVAIDGTECAEFTVSQNPPICDCSTLMITPSRNIAWDAEGETIIASYTPSVCYGKLTITKTEGDWAEYSKIEEGYIYGTVSKNDAKGAIPRYASFNVSLSDGTQCSEKSFQITQLAKSDCSCDYISSRITYINKYLPYAGTTNEICFFSADTQGCGTLTGYCSSSQSNGILYGDGENLVSTRNIDGDPNKFGVYGKVNPFEGSVTRSCAINIRITMVDDTECQELAIPIIQDPKINCDKTDIGFDSITLNSSGGNGIIMVYTPKSMSDVANMVIPVLGISETHTWIKNVKYAYEYADGPYYGNRLNIYADVSENPGTTKRLDTVSMMKIILNSALEINRKYTLDEIVEIGANTYCSFETCNIIQNACDCSSLWIGRYSYLSAFVTYTKQTYTMSKDYLKTGINFDCGKIDSISLTDQSIDYVTNLSVNDTGDEISFDITENTSVEYTRDFEIALSLVDNDGNSCGNSHTVHFIQHHSPTDCNDCEFIDSKVITYDLSCAGHGDDGKAVINVNVLCTFTKVSLDSNYDGINENQKMGIENFYSRESANSTNVYINPTLNTDNVEKYINVVYKFKTENGSICTVERKIKQEAFTGCSKTSYDLQLSYVNNKGDSESNPLEVNGGETGVVIGYIKNKINDFYSSCMYLTGDTQQTGIVPRVEIVENSTSAEPYYKVIVDTVSPTEQPSEIATVGVSWIYGNNKQGGSGIFYVKVNKV